MKLIKLSLAAVVLATGLVSTASASESSVSVSGDMSLTSNYIFRGASLSGNTPTVQGTLGVEHTSGVYAGIWASGLSVGSEIDLYAGYATELAGVGIDAGFVAYAYTDPVEEELVLDEWGEVYLGLSYAISDLSLGATVYKGVMSEDEDTLTIEVGADYDFGVAYIGAAYGTETDSEVSYYSATIGAPVDSLNGDLSFTFASTDVDDADSVFAVTYTTAF